jgi:hypothetical protein
LRISTNCKVDMKPVAVILNDKELVRLRPNTAQP